MELVGFDRESMTNFAKLSIEYIQEMDKKSLQKEIDAIMNYSNINNYWIFHEQVKIGLVKIFRNNFYALTFFREIQDHDQIEIIKLIEEYTNTWFEKRIEAIVHSRFYKILKIQDYSMLYSRTKLVINFEQAQNLISYDDINIHSFDINQLELLVSTFIDAFQGTFDEKTGFFNSKIAHSSLQSIIRGHYGEFRPELSGIIYDNQDQSILGGALITISENIPFVILVGIKSEQQNKGYGRKLFSYLFEKSKDEGFDEMKLWVTVENTVASEFYLSLGFEILSTVHTMEKIIT